MMVEAGFDQPTDRLTLLTSIYGKPCQHCKNNRNGPMTLKGGRSTYNVDCGGQTTVLTQSMSTTGMQGWWTCADKPKPIPIGPNGTCPANCNMVREMHSDCYTKVATYTIQGKKYFTAIPHGIQAGGDYYGGDWGSHVCVVGCGPGRGKYVIASCLAKVGQQACWPCGAPIHVTDGGGPTDQVREERVQQIIQHQVEKLYPKLEYNPLLKVVPKGVDLDPQTMDIIEATHQVLNLSNPKLAEDCWLCLGLGVTWPLAFPLLNASDPPSPTIDNCTLTNPFKVQPTEFNTSLCFWSPMQNNPFDVDLGLASFTTCSSVVNLTSPGCLLSGKVFVCGDNMAYPFLPINWTDFVHLPCLHLILTLFLEMSPSSSLVLIPSSPNIREQFNLPLSWLGWG